MASSSTPIRQQGQVAPTPQNTPLANAPISQSVARPGVSDIAEEAEPPEADVAAILQSSAGRSVLEDIVKGRLASLIGQSSGYVESLPVEAKRSLAALQGVQAQHEKLQKDFKREVWELEKKVRLFYVNICPSHNLTTYSVLQPHEATLRAAREVCRIIQLRHVV